jgi:hypothetical protein
MYVDIAHALMVVHGVILSKSVSEICGTRLALDNKLVRVNLVTDPVVVRVDGLGSLLFDGTIGNAYSTLVVPDDQSGCLRVPSIKVLLAPVASRPTKKSAAYSTFVADDTIMLLIQLR